MDEEQDEFGPLSSLKPFGDVLNTLVQKIIEEVETEEDE